MPTSKLLKGMTMYRLEDGDYPQHGYSSLVNVRHFRVVKETPCGAWVSEAWDDGDFGLIGNGKKRFILNGPGRRFCYPDLGQARQSYLCRKRKHLEHLERSMARAKAGQAEASKPDFVRTRMAEENTDGTEEPQPVTIATNPSITLCTATSTTINWLLIEDKPCTESFAPNAMARQGGIPIITLTPVDT